MRDIMKQVDNSLMLQVPNKSYHNLDSQILTTTEFGRLTPTYMIETVPGATYTITPETLLRFQPLSSPLMHKCSLKTMYFHVPYRILWKNWEYFITGKKDPYTGLDPIHPYYTADRLKLGIVGVNGVGQRIPDYFGVKRPDGNDADLVDIKLNPFPFIAYQSIYNRWFRHKLVENEVISEISDGEVDLGVYTQIVEPRTITYEDDYFNSMLPTPQAGDASSIIDKAQVYVDIEGAGDKIDLDGVLHNIFVRNSEFYDIDKGDIASNELFADVNITIEEIRKANAMQKYLETAQAVGNYIDFLKAYYNVDFPDNRAQEPEYLGGVSVPVTISDVMNVSDDHQGRLTGNGATYSKGDEIKYTSLEHGMIIGISVVTYKPTYVHAKSRLHLKTDKFDYFNPIFDALGEQATKLGEINQLTLDAQDTIGYVPRHYEYRSSFDIVTGEMATSYMHWHLARNTNLFTGVTTDFYKVEDERRIFQVQDSAYDPIMLQVYNNVGASLPMGQLPNPSIV